MNEQLIDAVDVCINALDAGIQLEDCLKLYPGMVNELRPLLEIAQLTHTMATKQVPVAAMNRSRTMLLLRANQFRNDKDSIKHPSFLYWLTRPFRSFGRARSTLSSSAGRLIFALLIALGLVLTSGGLLVTSAKSLPGDTLYPVKRVVEDISVQLAPRGENHQSIEDNYRQQRISEVRSLISLERVQQVSFEGVVESKSGNHWVVSGIPVNLQSDTTIVSDFNGTQSIEVGMLVEVEGVTQVEDWVNAHEIHLREYHFIGLVEKIAASQWQISGIQFQLVHNVQIDSGIQVGDDVTVLVRSEDNGLFALAIVRDLHPEAIPSVIPTLTPTPSFDPTANIRQERELTGTVETIAINYWVVSGQIIYIVDDTDIQESIQISDHVTVHYIIEANGSFTAVGIEKNGNGEYLGEGDNQATPEGDGGEGDAHMTSTPAPGDDDGDETPEITQTPDHHETPDPTEGHEQPENPTQTPTP